jgi:hypothetical protein
MTKIVLDAYVSPAWLTGEYDREGLSNGDRFKDDGLKVVDIGKVVVLSDAIEKLELLVQLIS